MPATSPNKRSFDSLDKTIDKSSALPPLCSLLDIPPEVLDQAMAKAFCLYQAGRLPEAAILCTGLLAADHRYWWAYSLYAAVLRKQGRLAEALIQVEQGLRFEPRQPKLLAMRAELVKATEPRPSQRRSTQSSRDRSVLEREAA